MLYFYIVIFLVGVLYTFVSLLISGLSGAFHGGSDIGSGIDGHSAHHGDFEVGHADTDTGHLNANHHHVGQHSGDINGTQTEHVEAGGVNNVLSFFAIFVNPIVAVSFLTVLGGLGIMGTKYLVLNSIIVLVGSIAAAVIISAALYNFVAKPLYKCENSTDVSKEQLIGTPAIVTTDILENGYGTIAYTVNSIRYTGPAKNIELKGIKQGQRVLICKIESNTFFVSELETVLN